ncbi:MAG: hypothetical protein AAFQ65_03600 [Myxococcota bacterium]
MKRRIILKREPAWYAKLRRLKIMVDEEQVGTLRERETLELEVPNGSMFLQARMDWARTKPLFLPDLANGTCIVFQGQLSWDLNPTMGVGRMLPFTVTVMPQQKLNAMITPVA